VDRRRRQSTDEPARANRTCEVAHRSRSTVQETERGNDDENVETTAHERLGDHEREYERRSRTTGERFDSSEWRTASRARSRKRRRVRLHTPQLQCTGCDKRRRDGKCEAD
jgi:hypothetical protein